MLSIEEIKLRVLSELQEAGEETVAAMANTILERSGDRHVIDMLRQALDELIQEGMIRMAFRKGSGRLSPLPTEDSLQVVGELQSVLRVRESEMYWTWATDSKPQIIATAAGIKRADQILAEHGYQWWRPKP
jgi:hypothetical protein